MNIGRDLNSPNTNVYSSQIRTADIKVAHGFDKYIATLKSASQWGTFVIHKHPPTCKSLKYICLAYNIESTPAVEQTN